MTPLQKILAAYRATSQSEHLCKTATLRIYGYLAKNTFKTLRPHAHRI
jgi:hypothetical protein